MNACMFMYSAFIFIQCAFLKASTDRDWDVFSHHRAEYNWIPVLRLLVLTMKKSERINSYKQVEGGKKVPEV